MANPAQPPQTTEHGGGVWSIPVPIPDNPLGHTLVHLVETDTGPVVVDTGWDHPSSWQALTEGLRACGTSVEELKGVVLTHYHPDHHGLSARVREASGAWIAMHAADADVVRRSRETAPASWLLSLLDRLALTGAPEEEIAPLRAFAAEAGPDAVPGHHAALPDREIVPGELLDLPGRRLRAIWTPGHTPGHVCLHLEEEHPNPGTLTGHGRLFSGDHLLPTVSPHIGLYEDPEDDSVDPLGDYLDSLERVDRLRPAEVLPAHQYAFTDSRGRVAELLSHHGERLEEMYALLAEGPCTPWELAERMTWNRPWAEIPFASRGMAVSEVAAHLWRLVKLGRAEQVPESDPGRYRAA
ncbi:MBL fold metallo-hydrolase [Streptomyces xiaopingdaonensis]|uniref:MBL fold metallo-hydrolase n=1 Tax=Streptomyces xiaopingdaonensis TaxID=1565415 RepID=UPI000381F792|nr:MBL fold metallo-hydrolase [Streptomyces xiaopingdaonensis]